MQLRSADHLIWKFIELGEKLAAPHTGSGVLHSGIVYADACAHCPGKTWMPKGFGQPPFRFYRPVCRRCQSDWGLFMADIRTFQVDHGRHDYAGDRLAELATLGRMLQKVPLWHLRVWVLRVLSSSLTWEEVTQEARQRWRRKHVSVPAGFFSERRCRTLVYEARDDAERMLVRAGMWRVRDEGGEWQIAESL